MADTDSFIEEVTEEVRRDQLFRLFRRYGWIAIALVILLVGGAAVREYRLAQQRQTAEAIGSAVFDALRQEDLAARASALGEIPAEGDVAAVVAMLTAAADLERDEVEQAAAQLEAIAADASLSDRYRHMAALKRVMILQDVLSAEERGLALSALTTPGAPYRLLAEEQLALIDVETGDVTAAIDRLNRIASDQEATAPLRRRATDVIVALGGRAAQ